MTTARPAPTTRIRPRREPQSRRRKRIGNQIFDSEVAGSLPEGLFKRIGQSFYVRDAQREGSINPMIGFHLEILASGAGTVDSCFAHSLPLCFRDVRMVERDSVIDK